MLRFLLELGPNLWRLARVAATFRKTGAMERVLEAAGAPRRLSAPLMFITAPGLIVGMKGDASLPVARAINALGPAYIKLGQILSTRPDVIGPELARDMRTLQDKLPPFPMAEARKAVRDALGREVEEIFAEFAPRSPPHPSRRSTPRSTGRPGASWRSRFFARRSRSSSEKTSPPST